MANPQPTDSGTKMANSILDELNQRNFSKAQIRIILTIVRVSWGCQSKFALIPNYTKYFQICGLYKQNIKKELDFLVANKVIFWSKDSNVFQFNKNFDEWKIQYTNESSKALLNELIHLNLKSNKSNDLVINNITPSLNNYDSVIKFLLPEQAKNADSKPDKDLPIDSIIDSNYINNKNKNFHKPSIQEIQNYCNDRNNGINPEQFFDFYESKGWMIGKSRMKDWKSAVRTWERNKSQGEQKPITGRF